MFFSLMKITSRQREPVILQSFLTFQVQLKISEWLLSFKRKILLTKNILYRRIVFALIIQYIKLPSAGDKSTGSFVKSSSKFETSVSDFTTGLKGGFI